jgi:uncharacterized membrane protein
MGSPDSWSDQAIVVRIGLLLRAGVLASASVILLGGAIQLYHHGLDRPPDRSRFDPAMVGPEFSHPGAIIRVALLGHDPEARHDSRIGPGAGRGRALIQLGLLLLIATPVMRVGFCVFAFARQRDVVYVVLPLIVLGVLFYSLFSRQIH